MSITTSSYSAPTNIQPKEGIYGYETVAASQTAQVLGSTGAAGDTLVRLIVSITAATNSLLIIDGSTTLITFTNIATVGTHVIEVGTKCATAWKITTGADTAVIAIGDFT